MANNTLCKYNFYDEVNDIITGGQPYKNPFEYFNIASIPSDYTNWSTIENNDIYGQMAADYVRATFEMWLLFDAKAGTTEAEKWANCTTSEKTPLARRHIIKDKALRLEIFTEAQDKQNFIEHGSLSISARQERIDNAIILLGYEIPDIDDRKDIFSDTELLIPKFITVNDSSLIDYMNGQGVYTGGGYPAKTYFAQSTLDLFNEIVKDGIY